MRISRASRFGGVTRVPGDKSVSHRALIFGAISRGESRVTNLLASADVRSTRDCLERMGVVFREDRDGVRVIGKGLRGLGAPARELDCGNSGTTMRVMMGLLAGQAFSSRLVGDESLSRRPMRRASEPLRSMGAEITLAKEQFAPVQIHGKRLHSIDYELKVASAQVKTALLLAGLYADGETVLRGAVGSRDHTERMLPFFGVELEKSPGRLSIRADQELSATDVVVPGDPSSAAFWLAAACLVPGGSVEVEGISLNPTRTGFLEVLRRMGARVEEQVSVREPEPVGTVRVSAPSGLRGTVVRPEEVPSLIDEIPVLAVLATQAEGRTEIQGAEELRVKETDRIEAVAVNLRAMGVGLETFEGGLAVHGRQLLRAAPIRTFLDHRIAMAFSVAALVAEGVTEIDHPECVSISYPDFFETLERLVR
ncbi:MAG: 3-phosphoshikimate 1-carboxyvinyltransferase [Oligoflexia bacterium]|nr:3-phosphoshikimate 1-carboxyvinyltransferase [Oligoflexia bacterium]